MRRAIELLFLVPFCVFSANGQQPVPDFSADGKAVSGYMAKWDQRVGELMFYRIVDSRSAVAIRLVKPDGGSVAIRPLEDLPGARSVTIWDIAETLDGGAVFCATVEYAPPHTKPMPLKSLVMTYDVAGRLTRFWDVYPYGFLHIAVDSTGAVFAFGAKSTADDHDPLLVKYSQDGRVLGQFLPANLFSGGLGVLNTGPTTGESEMFVAGERIFLWLATTQELLTLSRTGEVVGRTSLQNALKSLAAETNSSRAIVNHVSVRRDGEIVAQVQLGPLAGTKAGVKMAMVAFSTDTTVAHPISTIMEAKQSGHFLGVSQDGKLLFLEPGPEQAQLMIRRY
jgi:hypothetical protein